MIALDTNLLVYAHRSGAAEHEAARRAITRASESESGFGFSLPVACEFWSVVTRAAPAGRPSTPREASGFLMALLEAGCAVWNPGPGFWFRLARLATARSVVGPRLFDLQIALIARENGARELWTADRAFVSAPGLRVVLPLDTGSM